MLPALIACESSGRQQRRRLAAAVAVTALQVPLLDEWVALTQMLCRPARRRVGAKLSMQLP